MPSTRAGPRRHTPSRTLPSVSKAKTVFRCGACGAASPKWAGRCGACGEWNTLVEEAGAVGATEAARIVRVHAGDWRAYRDNLAGAAPMAEGEPGRAAGGKIGAAVEEKAPAAAPG